MSIVPSRSLPGAAANYTGYNIQRSLRFRSSASAYLNRTPASAGNRQTWTWSGWVKRGNLASQQMFWSTNVGATPFSAFYFDANNYFNYYEYTGSNYVLTSNAVYRDPSAWYHVVIAMDTTQATAANRTKIYINGQQITSFSSSTYVPQNTNTAINSAVATSVGNNGNGGAYFDGYLAEVNFVDGQALTPSAFGSTNDTTGAWLPAKYTGTYGTNGFYLPFSDNTSATTLAYDKSGNGNNWTANNISTTAGATYDSMTDVPTLTSATAANFCVLNPLDNAGTAISGSANLGAYTANCSGRLCGTQAVSSGKYYWEAAFTGNDTGQTAMFGICQDYNTAQAYVTYGYYATGAKYSFASGSSSYGSSWTNNDVIGIALDMDAGTIAFYKNGVAQGTAFTGLTGGWKPAFSSDYGTSGRGIVFWANFGQQPFSYTPPTGFVALNAFNLPTPTIPAGNKYMDATLYTGNGSTQTITNAAGFQPNFAWLKTRSQTFDNVLFDSVRGATKQLSSNTTGAEATYVNSLTAFNSNGFSVGSDAVVNSNTNTYVGWQWKESATAGFDIVTYSGSGSAQNIAHNLGVAPSWMIVKARNVGSTNWFIYTATQGNTKYLDFSTGTGGTDSSAWNNTSPTSSVFTVGSSYYTNWSGTTYVAYLFSEIPGFSKFGSYTGNGSADGPFVYCGFRPKYIMIKRVDSSGENWEIQDTSRFPYNVSTTNTILYADTSSAEVNSAAQLWDVLSNGFKQRATGGGNNANGGTYIYAAFAENPFKYANAR